MTENNKSVLISTREHKIGKTTFIVSSYADSSSKKTAQDLIMDMLFIQDPQYEGGIGMTRIIKPQDIVTVPEEPVNSENEDIGDFDMKFMFGGE